MQLFCVGSARVFLLQCKLVGRLCYLLVQGLNLLLGLLTNTLSRLCHLLGHGLNLLLGLLTDKLLLLDCILCDFAADVGL